MSNVYHRWSKLKHSLSHLRGHHFLWLSVFVGATSAAYLIWTAVTILEVGKTPATLTYSDVAQYLSLSEEVGGVTAKSQTVSSLKQSFQTLAISQLKKEILLAENLGQYSLQEAAQKIEAESPYDKILSSRRQKLGDSRYFRLFIEPIVVSQLFEVYYDATDPNRKKVMETFQLAADSGLDAAAKQLGVSVVTTALPALPINRELIKFATENPGKTYPKVVAFTDAFAIVQPVEVTDSVLNCRTVSLPRTPLAEFIVSKQKTLGIQMTSSLLSWFRVSDLTSEKGPLHFAPKAVKD